MATEVFISWSGDLSRKLGEALRDWLPGALQYVKPYFSPEDIEKGAKWDTDIAAALESSDVGVICLTPDNMEKPWILFEAGALSKSMGKSSVCPLLFGIEPTDVTPPLSNLQATRFGREDFKKLITTINNSAGDAKLGTDVLDDVFGMWWPRLETKVQEILASPDGHTAKERRPQREMIEEILELTRSSASRQIASPRIAPAHVRVLMQTLEEMMPLLDTDSESIQLLRTLNRPLGYLCKMAGLPRMATHYRHTMGSIFGLRAEATDEPTNDVSGDRPRPPGEDGE